MSLTSSGDFTGWLTRAGSYSVQVSASDPAGATQSQSFSWTVSAATGQGPTGPVRFGVGGKCLSDVGNGSANGTPVALGSCTGSAAQWTAAADRTLRIHGQCLSVSGSAKKSGTREVLEPCTGYASQQWATGTGVVFDDVGDSVVGLVGPRRAQLTRKADRQHPGRLVLTRQERAQLRCGEEVLDHHDIGHVVAQRVNHLAVGRLVGGR